MTIIVTPIIITQKRPLYIGAAAVFVLEVAMEVIVNVVAFVAIALWLLYLA